MRRRQILIRINKPDIGRMSTKYASSILLNNKNKPGYIATLITEKIEIKTSFIFKLFTFSFCKKINNYGNRLR